MAYERTALEKGWIGRIEDGNLAAMMDFQFNPSNERWEVMPSYNFIDPPGSAVPTAVFKSIGSDDLEMTILLDATEKYSERKLGITAQRSFLESLVRQDLNGYISGIGRFTPPPEVIVVMGTDFWYCVATRFSCRITRRNRRLIPTRAFIDMSFSTIFFDQDTLDEQYLSLKEFRDLAEIK